MARILVAAVQIPFVRGGAESHVEGLVRELQARGHHAELLRLPFKWYPHRQLLREAVAWRCLRIPTAPPHGFDLVIATRFPTYLIRHPRKVTWLIHQHRQVYDLLHTPMTDFHDTIADDQIRRAIYELDRRFLPESRIIYANSRRVAERLRRFNGLPSRPLYHPPPLSGKLHPGPHGRFILSVGRIELTKRVDLLVRAMQHVPPPARAVVVGQGPQLPNIRALARELGVAERITFAGFQPEEKLIELYATAGAVYFAPLDEDLGYITMEAFLARKPVVGCSDSGGVLEFLQHERTGLVAEPDPRHVGRAIHELLSNPERARTYGNAGYELVKEISWENAVQALLAPLHH
jgi:glycosyltransferase involved in cell wall biosynthesis